MFPIEGQRRPSYGSSSPVVGERGAQTRQRIVEAALACFDERGYHATSVDDIASAVGISRAALYQYFENKQAIFVELMNESGDALLRVVRRLGPVGPTALGFDNLHWWLGEWAWVYDKYAIAYVQWANAESPQAPIRPLILQFMDSYIGRVSEPLSDAPLEGLDAQTAALVILAMVTRVNYYRHTMIGRRFSDGEVIDTLAVVVQLMLFPQTPTSVLAAEPREFESLHPNGRRSGAARPDRGPSASDVSSRIRGGVPTGQDRLVGGSTRVRQTVHRLLDAGSHVFGLLGYHMAGVEDIVREAGLGRGTFYKYFTDKQAMLDMLAMECAEQLPTLTGALGDVRPGRPGAEQALQSWLVEFVRFHRRYAGVFRALQDVSPSTPALDRLSDLVAGDVLGSLERLLEAVDRPYPFSVRVGSVVLLALLERLPDQLLGTRYDQEPDDLASVLAIAIRQGFLGSHGSSTTSGSTSGSSSASSTRRSGRRPSAGRRNGTPGNDRHRRD